MALVDLIARLEREAEARASELEAKAEVEARALEAKAAVRGEERKAHALAERRAARRARHEAELAEARRRSQRAQLEAQHAFLERVFARARALLPELEGSEAYLAIVPRHFDEARRYLEGLPVVARCSPRVASVLSERSRGLREASSREVPNRSDAADLRARGSSTPLGENGGVEVTVHELASPGLVLSSADGSVFVDHTLGARLDALRPRLAVKLVADVLGGRRPC